MKINAAGVDVDNEVPNDNQMFGSAVGISGDFAVSGAYGVDDNCNGYENCGAAYIYEWHGDYWSQVTKLTASDANAGDFFGRAIGPRGNSKWAALSPRLQHTRLAALGHSG